MKSFSPFKTPKNKQQEQINQGAQNNLNNIDQKRNSVNSMQGYASLSKSMTLASINKIKCTFHSHQQQDVSHICLFENCNKASRLACSKCIQGFHSDHASQMIQINQFIFSGRLQDPVELNCAMDQQNNILYNVTNWPVDQTAQNIKDYIVTEQSYAETLFEELEQYFKGVEKNLLAQIDQIKQKFKFEVLMYYKRGEGKKKIEFIENLKKKYESVYNLKDLQIIMQNYLNREISFDVFQSQVQFFLSNRESQQQRQSFNNFFVQNIESPNKPQIKIEKQQLICIEKIINDGLNKISQCLMQPVQENPIQSVPPMGKLGQAPGQKNNNNSQEPDWATEFETISNFLTTTLKKKNEKKDLISYGTEVYADGSKFEGFFLNNTRNYFGSRYFLDGSIYCGEWKNGQRNGNGIMYYQSGNIYQGQWLDDKKSGSGKEILISGKIYEGQYLNDMKNGQGKQYLIDGKIYEGEFKNDQRVGIGKLTYKNGTVQQINVDQMNDNQKKILNTQENK